MKVPVLRRNNHHTSGKEPDIIVPEPQGPTIILHHRSPGGGDFQPSAPIEYDYNNYEYMPAQGSVPSAQDYPVVHASLVSSPVSTTNNNNKYKNNNNNKYEYKGDYHHLMAPTTSGSSSATTNTTTAMQETPQSQQQQQQQHASTTTSNPTTAPPDFALMKKERLKRQFVAGVGGALVGLFLLGPVGALLGGFCANRCTRSAGRNDEKRLQRQYERKLQQEQARELKMETPTAHR